MPGEDIRMFRLYSGLTQAQVSEAIGVDVGTYRAFETESAQPSREIIEKLAALYNAEPERLLNGFSGNEKYILFQEPPYNVYENEDQKEKEIDHITKLSKEEKSLVLMYRALRRKRKFFDGVRSLFISQRDEEGSSEDSGK